MSETKLNNLSIGYIPFSKTISGPADRRRFIFFAKEAKLKYEIFNPNKIYDLVIANTLSDPGLLLKLPKKTKLLFDFTDAYMAENIFSIRALFRGLYKYSKGLSSKFYLNYKKAFIDIMKRSEVVICSSLEQKKLIMPYCKKIQIILDSHIEECTKVKKNYNNGEFLNIGWEGQHATLPCLLSLLKKISASNLNEHIKYHIVTDENIKTLDKLKYGKSMKRYLKNKNLNIIFYPWSIENVNNLADICDFAIIPVDLKNPMHKLKPENRIHLFWRLGLPVLASSTDSNVRAMQNCNHDLYAKTYSEWIKIIESLRVSPEKIYNYSQTAFDYINAKFTSKYYVDLWTEALINCLE